MVQIKKVTVIKGNTKLTLSLLGILTVTPTDMRPGN